MAKRLRGGYTTGACVAAGAKAAALYMQDSLTADAVEITALDGTRLMIPIKKIERLDDGRLTEGALPPVIRAEVVKDAGDDPDITNGTSVFVTLTLAWSEDDLKAVPGVSVRHENILFEAGEGIGHATKPGLSLSVGEPAINPGPRQLVHNSLLEAFGSPRPCRVRIDIPDRKSVV